MFQTIKQGLKDIFFPDNCCVCRQFINNRHQQQLCESCLSKIQLNTPPFCLRCSRHLDQFSPTGLCTSCSMENYCFDHAWSACLYDDPLSHLLHQFKYNGKTALRRTFFTLMTNYIDRFHLPLNQFDYVTPLSLHSSRLRERGYNQSALIAQDICNHYQLQLVNDIIIRVQPTLPQANLNQKQRWTNVQGAFKINPSTRIADKSVLIVDDLLTTGATASFAASALKEAGAAYVGVLTLAITKLNDAHIT